MQRADELDGFGKALKFFWPEDRFSLGRNRCDGRFTPAPCRRMLARSSVVVSSLAAQWPGGGCVAAGAYARGDRKRPKEPQADGTTTHKD